MRLFSLGKISLGYSIKILLFLSDFCTVLHPSVELEIELSRGVGACLQPETWGRGRGNVRHFQKERKGLWIG